MRTVTVAPGVAYLRNHAMKGNISMDPKQSPKERATSAPRVQAPAGATPPAKARANTPVAREARLRFLPGQCHFKNEAGKATCKRPRPTDKPSHLLCDEHEKLWHAGKLRLSKAGTVRLLARLEVAKLDPTTKPKTTKATAKRTSTPAPQPARVAHPRNAAAPLPEATVVRVP